MDELGGKLNSLIVKTFNIILKTEEAIISEICRYDLTITEIHLIENAAHFEGGCTASELAARLKVSLPTVTVAVNKLARKGFLVKEKNPDDTRSVKIRLTQTGEEVNRVHHSFHKKLIEDISEGISQSEKALLAAGVQKIHDYFENLSKRYN